jgi:hypothetical protein
MPFGFAEQATHTPTRQHISLDNRRKEYLQLRGGWLQKLFSR